MILTLYQVDAFSDRVFAGNPAAVVPLESWPPDGLLQAIAAENNLSETAFFVAGEEGFQLRWFTPLCEVDLCGHATLATAAVLYERRAYGLPRVRFQTRSGWLMVEQVASGRYRLDFPAKPAVPAEITEAWTAALGVAPTYLGRSEDYMAVLASEGELRRLQPDFSALARLGGRGVLVTARGTEDDFVSRCFFPGLGIDEDPVTGSAHCTLAPYWASVLGRPRLSARQLSRRSGELICEVEGDRVRLTGSAVHYLTGTLELDDSLFLR